MKDIKNILVSLGIVALLYLAGWLTVKEHPAAITFIKTVIGK